MSDLAFLKGRAASYLEWMPPEDVGTTRGLNVAIFVPSESVGLRLQQDLERAGYSELRLARIRSWILKRWVLSALSVPVEQSVPAIHQWLDELDTLTRSYNAKIGTWIPTR